MLLAHAPIGSIDLDKNLVPGSVDNGLEPGDRRSGQSSSKLRGHLHDPQDEIVLSLHCSCVPFVNLDFISGVCGLFAHIYISEAFDRDGGEDLCAGCKRAKLEIWNPGGILQVWLRNCIIAVHMQPRTPLIVSELCFEAKVLGGLA